MKRKIILLLTMCMSAVMLHAEDGHNLWLRYRQASNNVNVSVECAQRQHPTVDIAQNELKQYWHGTESVLLRVQPDEQACQDAYTISRQDGALVITAASQNGVLYGTYALLRMQEMDAVRTIKAGHPVQQTPSNAIRILNHWDNPNGTVERGYSGSSIWKWDQISAQPAPKAKKGKGNRQQASKSMPDSLVALYTQYARANASIGINAVVLNNVNAKPMMLSTEMLQKTAAIADILRPYGIRVYQAVNFGSPHAIGGLDTADPLDPRVQKWWADKVEEIYRLIPDFGGFLVKANSEGEPGPMDYKRTHVDGANMMADALKPHGGIVMWRSFVYAPDSKDRASQAYDEFVPLDGKFRDNVIIQIKNGPVDFQPREPISPLLFALKKTKTMPEFQITQEYTGHSIHTCFLAPMWKEYFGYFDVVKQPQQHHAIAGVANIGDNVNWCGSDMAQANWYAFGRLAWDENLTSEQIAREFLTQTFTADVRFVKPMTALLMRSRETVVSYMMPLGLHHIFAGGHHYGPEPWYAPRGSREDWLPRYYHRADAQGLGFDRSMNGSRNVAQYPEPLRSLYDDINTCPEDLILWFHHVSWNHTMRNGLTLWDNLCYKFDEGALQAAKFVQTWQQMKPYVDGERYAQVLWRMQRQAADAWWWHDACLLYFQAFSGQEFPADMVPTRYTLDELMKFRINIDNYRAPRADQLPQVR